MMNLAKGREGFPNGSQGKGSKCDFEKHTYIWA
jgi:hypothetical protein